MRSETSVGRCLLSPHANGVSPWFVAVLAAACSSLAGCYDGEAMLQNARSAAFSTTLAEVDLGEYHTTLPRDPLTGLFTTVDVRIFAAVPRAKLSEVKKQLKADEHQVRHHTLTAVRTVTSDELCDPSFMALRKRIEQAINEVLADAPVKSIGFYHLSLR